MAESNQIVTVPIILELLYMKTFEILDKNIQVSLPRCAPQFWLRFFIYNDWFFELWWIIEHFAAQAGECFCTHQTRLMSTVEVLTRKWALQKYQARKEPNEWVPSNKSSEVKGELSRLTGVDRPRIDHWKEAKQPPELNLQSTLTVPCSSLSFTSSLVLRRCSQSFTAYNLQSTL